MSKISDNLNDHFKDELVIFTEWNPNPIIKLNFEGEILYLNLAARAQFSNISALNMMHPILNGVCDSITHLADNNHEFIVLAREITFYESIYEQHIFAMPDQRLIFIYMNDITERRLAEEQILKFNKELENRVAERTLQLEEMNTKLKLAKEKAELLAEKAEDANRAKSAFLATMSHEIRTPLNGVIGMTSLLFYTRLSSEQLEYVKMIKSSGEILLTIINDILDFSKIESGRMGLEDAQFDLSALIKNEMEIINAQALPKDIQVSYELDPNVPSLLTGDSAKICQVLNNFLSNALKFTEKGHITLHVKLQKREKKRVYVLFEVIDTGIGISDKARSHLFQPFSQGDSSTSRKYGGTGLGLAIAKRLIEIMSGTFTFESNEGQGSKFSFIIPLRTADNKHLEVNQTESYDFKIKMPTQKNAKILLAEDNFINQQVALQMLEKLGYHADFVENGSQVLNAIQTKSYDLILMDCQMPDMDGYTATKEIRKLENGSDKHIKIIAMTAHALKDDRAKSLACGMDDYISKPIEMKQLDELLNRWLS